MPAFIDLSGQRFGRLVVVDRAQKEWKGAAWRCRCDCGGEVVVRAGSLSYGQSRSCGCLQREGAAERMGKVKLKHGLARQDGTRHPDYGLWRRMRQRCTDPRCEDYPDYGGRGIRVCARWDDFAAFLADMGARPSKRHSIDRIDVNGDYTHLNCRWALPTTQARNSRRAILSMEKADEIRRRRTNGEGYEAIAVAVGTTKSAVRHVIHDGTWSRSTEEGRSAKAG
jgi:hypothetical protein